MASLYRNRTRCVDRDSHVLLRLYRRILASPFAILLLGFLILYFLSIQYYRHASYRDPTSYFFDSRRAYQRIYSADRIEEARVYLSDSQYAYKPNRSSSETPFMCVGIATVARRGEQYVGITVGSLLAGLNQAERDQIFLNILVGHTDLSVHPVFAEEWMTVLPDRVLGYAKDSKDSRLIQEWEEGGWYRNKTIYDYTYLLKDCYNTGAEYVMMIEDDTLAVGGWYARAVDALKNVQSEMRLRPKQQWLYLRLFYADDLLGWNSEQWLTYFFWSFTVWFTLTSLIVMAKNRLKRQLDFLSPPIIAVVSLTFIPAVIALHFLAGKQTMWPIAPGIHQMNKYGCCSQGFIFPRALIPQLLERTDLETDWLVDMMIEQIADKEGWIRWVIVPALLQHLGATSSKGYGFDDSARRLWNFRFEEYISHRSG